MRGSHSIARQGVTVQRYGIENQMIIEDHTCGFWVAGFVLCFALGMGDQAASLPYDAMIMKRILAKFLSEFKFGNKGGLSRQTILEVFSPNHSLGRTLEQLGHEDEEIVSLILTVITAVLIDIWTVGSTIIRSFLR
jgi:hypothetical protein